jgi:acyl-CoA thioester hydrolase
LEHEAGAGRFSGREHSLPVHIYVEDTDFSGVVYHANYVRYLERGRSDFIRMAGASHTSLARGPAPVAFMVSEMTVRFLRPARLDDRLEIRTLMESVRGARLLSRQTVTRGADLILEATVENVCVSLDGKPRRLPAFMADRLRPYLAQPQSVSVQQRAYGIAAE